MYNTPKDCVGNINKKKLMKCPNGYQEKKYDVTGKYGIFKEDCYKRLCELDCNSGDLLLNNLECYN